MWYRRNMSGGHVPPQVAASAFVVTAPWLGGHSAASSLAFSGHGFSLPRHGLRVDGARHKSCWAANLPVATTNSARLVEAARGWSRSLT
jgi:hypothetical protein